MIIIPIMAIIRPAGPERSRKHSSQPKENRDLERQASEMADSSVTMESIMMVRRMVVHAGRQIPGIEFFSFSSDPAIAIKEGRKFVSFVANKGGKRVCLF